MLAGAYRFKIIDALTYQPVTKMTGDYTVSPREMGQWTSDDKGAVYLDRLKVGLTNVQVKDNHNYFNILINGAKVTKKLSTGKVDQGRTVLAVPRKIKDQIIFTMSWIGEEYNLNLFAETFIDTEEGRKEGNSCQLGFTNPKCMSMEHLDSRDHEALGETIRIESSLFFDSETNALIKDKKVLVYMVETSQNKRDISNTNAVLELTIPEQGRVSSVPVPFKAPQKEDINMKLVYNWWAALCISVEETTDQPDGNPSQLKITRLNKLLTSKPNPADLC